MTRPNQILLAPMLSDVARRRDVGLVALTRCRVGSDSAIPPPSCDRRQWTWKQTNRESVHEVAEVPIAAKATMWTRRPHAASFLIFRRSSDGAPTRSGPRRRHGRL